jgi:hypothetical protein
MMSASRTPDATIYAMDVSFAQLADKEEKAYLDKLPTSSSLPPEAVDRLRAAAGQIIMASPDFRRLIGDIGGKLEVDLPPASREAEPAVARNSGEHTCFHVQSVIEPAVLERDRNDLEISADACR